MQIMIDVTVAATCQAKVQKMALNKISAGVATDDAIKRKLNKYLAPTEAQGKTLQVIAFDSAGCPAPTTRTHLTRWIKAATPEPDDEGLTESEHIWRARLARSR